MLGAPRHPDRLFFVEPGGVIGYADAEEIWPDPDAGPRVVLGIGVRNTCCTNDVRLAAMAFPLSGSNRALCYVARTGAGTTVVSRLNHLPGRVGAEFTVWDYEEPLLTVAENLSVALSFGADNRLLIAFGAGTSEYAGRILRADVESSGTWSMEVVATGLRKPTLVADSFLIDSRDATDAIFAIRPGLNAATAVPLASYSRTQGCNVSGAVIHSGARFPEWKDALLIGHDCSSQLVIYVDGAVRPSHSIGRNV